MTDGNTTQVEALVFAASIGESVSALKFSGKKDGATVTLSIPETHILHALKLAAYRGLALKITVELLDEELEEYEPLPDDE